MKIGVVAAALAGLALVVYLAFYVGWAAVLSAIVAVGWGGFAILCAYSLALSIILGSAWFALVGQKPRTKLTVFVWSRLMRDAAGEVLPFSQFGGLLIGVRALVLRKISPPLAFASIIVDVTTEMVAQIIFIVVGLSFFLAHPAIGGSATPVPVAVISAVVFIACSSIGFIFLQRRGLGLAERLATRFVPTAAPYAKSLSGDIEGIYRTPLRLAASCLLHLTGWFASALATWLSVRLIGGHISMASAIAIESVLSALRSAAILVPGALGVQEAGYAMLMPLFGVSPGIGLAVSLLKRAREIAIGIPALLVWQGIEGRNALRTDTPLLEP